MCQRVFLAMARLLGSSILLADEPFASVDGNTQEKLSVLVRDWMRSRGMMLILVSHDLELLRQLTDHTLVLYRGQVAESGPTQRVLGGRRTNHPYTWLLEQVGRPVEEHKVWTVPSGSGRGPTQCWFAPRCAWSDPTVCRERLPELRPAAIAVQDLEARGADSHRLRCVRHPVFELLPDVGGHLKTTDRPRSDPGRELLRARSLRKEFRIGWLRPLTKPVLEEVTFSVLENERMGIMGPSGLGKTTLGRMLLGVCAAGQGEVELRVGERWVSVRSSSAQDRAQWRARIQMLYQDTDLVLDPAARVGDVLLEAYQVFSRQIPRAQCRRWGLRLLDALALPNSLWDSYPYRLSGGERKRVALARSLAAFGCPVPARPGDPWRLLVLDEPTSGVDVVLQSIVSRFLLWAQQQLRLSYLVISHDAGFVSQFCQRILRLEHGRVVQDSKSPAPPGR